ncbi:hypothetical protein V1511DRAFT_297348 [Dipodascopsis uninucleata]
MVDISATVRGQSSSRRGQARRNRLGISSRQSRKRRKVKRKFSYSLTESGDDVDDEDFKLSEDDSELKEHAKQSNTKSTTYLKPNKKVTQHSLHDDTVSDLPTGLDNNERSISYTSLFMHLPIELLERILIYVEPDIVLSKYQKQNLSQYCTVCRVFRDIIQRRVFENLRITQIKSLYFFSDILEHTPQIKEYPRMIRIELQSSLAEESNMVASALRQTITRLTNLTALDVLFTAPLGFQVIFPLLGRDFHAPSVKKLEITLGVFTSSFIPFVGGFRNLECLHLKNLNFEKLVISDKDKKIRLSSITSLMLSSCFIGPSTIELLSSVFPSLRDVSLFLTKGLTINLIRAIKANCLSFDTLNLYKCTDGKGRGASKIGFQIPKDLWKTLRVIRMYFCGGLRPELFPDTRVSRPGEVSNIKHLRIVDNIKRGQDRGSFEDTLKSIKRLGIMLSKQPDSVNIRDNELDILVCARNGPERLPYSIYEAFDEEYTSELASNSGKGTDILYSTFDTEYNRGYVVKFIDSASESMNRLEAYVGLI